MGFCNVYLREVVDLLRDGELERGGDGSYQLVVEPGTYKSGAILTRVRVPCAARFFPPESAFSADSLTVFVQPSCLKSHASSARTLKIPKTGCHTVGHVRIHPTLTGMDIAALAAAAAWLT